ncbi:MAG: TRAP transporter TatT component family protein [Candidatus Binatia bacterium]|nr:TRAP transporter TatT component family protein [Candidatus Binatia bacterium]
MMRRRVTVFSVVPAAAVLGVVWARPLRAEPDREVPSEPVLAAEQSPGEKAKALAKRALALLKQAEDAADHQEKRRLYEEGLRLADAALSLDERNADAHFARFATRGRLLLLDGATPNPLNLMRLNRDLDRALELNPNHADALAAKGGLYRQLPRLLGGSEAKAEECLTKAIALEPEHAVGARVELAQLYFDRGEKERAVALLKTAIAIAERDGKVRQKNEAEALLERYVGAIRGHP